MLRQVLRRVLTVSLVVCGLGCVSSDHELGTRQVGDMSGGARLSSAGQWILSDGTFEEPCKRALAIKFAPDGSAIYVKDTGGLVTLDAESLAVRGVLEMKVDGCAARGLAVSPDGRRILVAGAKRVVREAILGADGLPAWGRTFTFKTEAGTDSAPLGIAITEDGSAAWITWSKSGTLIRLSLESGEVTERHETGICPTDVVLSRDGRVAFVANFGGRRPIPGSATAESSGEDVMVDARGIPNSATISRIDLGGTDSQFDTGLQPSALALVNNGQTLLVAASGDDRLEAFDARTGARRATLDLRPTDDLPYGVLPDSLAVSPDQKRVAVACAGLNTVALVDLDGEGLPVGVAGHVATGWFPTGVAWSGARLVAASARGSGQQIKAKASDGFRARTHRGGVSLTTPSGLDLAESTRAALDRARLPEARAAMAQAASPREGQAPVPIPERLGEPSTIKHIVYVIKENRTYDQVFGDLPQGDGRADFCIYGREVTPNQHAIAERWVLMDNAYCNGVVSADGHAWTTQGIVTPYVERGFGGWARSYDHGTDALAYATSGFIWDAVLNRGLSFRNFGEYDFPKEILPKGGWFPIFADWKQGSRAFKFEGEVDIERLRRHTNLSYPGWAMAVPDQLRMDVFLKEFESWKRTGLMPSLTIVYLPQDHTSGTSENSPTPRAHVADNDLAVGRLVEALSKSPFWKETAVLSVEDDPQDGWDHVDGHRTVFLVASPWAKRNTVVKAFYNQNSVLHTICRILGIEPLTNGMASAPLMTDCFTDRPDVSPFVAIPSSIPLDEPNPAKVAALRVAKPELVAHADAMNFAVPDAIDDDTMNRVLWHLAKGPNAEYPAEFAGAHGKGLAARGVKAVRSATPDDDDDDDDDRVGGPADRPSGARGGDDGARRVEHTPRPQDPATRVSVDSRPAPEPGWRLVWSDEFDRDGAPDPTKWDFERGFVRNEELQWYRPENATVKGGMLLVEARRESVQNPQFDPQSKDWKLSRKQAIYTSASLITKGKATFTYGRFECRARYAIDLGLWPAWWMKGTTRPWPSCGEIDMMESYGGALHANAAWGSGKPGVGVWDSAKLPYPALAKATGFASAQKWSESFHLWRMDRDATSIRLYVDGLLLNEVDVTRAVNLSADGENPFLGPHFFILNLAVGATSGDPAKTPFPQRLEVDFVRVWEKETDQRGSKD